MIAWMFAGFLCMMCLALSRRVVALEEDVRVERALCAEAEARAERAEQQWQRFAEINHSLARKSAMWFRDVPTLDATAYRAEREPSPVVWWTYDN